MNKPIGKLLWHKAKLLDKSNWRYDRGYIFMIIPFQPTDAWFDMDGPDVANYAAERVLCVIQNTIWTKIRNSSFKVVNGMEIIRMDNTRSVSDHTCFHYSFVTNDEKFYEDIHDYFALRSRYVNSDGGVL